MRTVTAKGMGEGALRCTLALAMLTAILLAPRMAVAAEAGAEADKSKTGEQTSPRDLRLQFIEIRKSTKPDSPEFRTAIEKALQAAHERGTVDPFEITLRRQLGTSYRLAKELAKSSEVLKEIRGQDGDPDTEAYVLLLLGMNARESNDAATAYPFFQEAAEKYPTTSAGQSAKRELQRSVFRKYLPATELGGTDGRSRRGIVVGGILMALAVLVAIFARRQMRKGAREGV
jgi:hypothetical protein